MNGYEVRPSVVDPLSRPVVRAVSVELHASVPNPPRFHLDPDQLLVWWNKRRQVERKALPERQQDRDIGGNQRGEHRSFSSVSSLNRVHVGTVIGRSDEHMFGG
jgi:hypothetical protein